MFLSSTTPIDRETLQRIPTLYTDHPWEGVSGKYRFISTGRVLDTLRDEGIYPYSVRTSYTRNEDRKMYVKHSIRLRTSNVKPVGLRQVGDTYPEIVLTNSHNTKSAFIIEAGLFRLVCANGAVVNMANIGRYRVPHLKVTLSDVLVAIDNITETFPQVDETVRKFQGIQLSIDEQENYAKLALGLRWPDPAHVPFESARLLSYRRKEDNGTDLWSIYNVVQENLIKGQQGDPATHLTTTRSIHSVDSDLRINRALWTLTEQFANR